MRLSPHDPNVTIPLQTDRAAGEPRTTCRQVVELLSDYLDGALPAEVRARVVTHLASCRGCATYLDQLLEVVRRTSSLRQDNPPTGLYDRLRATFRDQRDR